MSRHAGPPTTNPPLAARATDGDSLTDKEPNVVHESLSLRKRLLNHRKHGLETLVALGALIGTVTGTLAWLDNRSSPLSLSAASPQGYAVFSGQIVPRDFAVAVVNRSSHAVSLIGDGSVFLGTRRVGRIAALAVGGSVDSDVTGVAATFPYTIQPGGSSNVRLKWVPDAPATRLLRQAAGEPQKPRIRLRLKFEPGGVKRVTVQEGRLPQQFFGWRTFLTLQSNRVAGIDLAAADVAAGSAVVTLRIWPGGSAQRKPEFVMSRPVSVFVFPNFRLPKLHAGRYLYSFSTETGAVAVGTFQTPCRGKDGRYNALLCADGDTKGTPPGPVLTY